MAQVALAPCSPFSVSTSLMRRTAELAEARGVRLHTHLAETRDEAEFCQSVYGCSPLDYLEQCGWLHERTWLAHGVHFNGAEIARLAAAGTKVTHARAATRFSRRAIARSARWKMPGLRSDSALMDRHPTMPQT
jgi:8-oxoguanine deaminase